MGSVIDRDTSILAIEGNAIVVTAAYVWELLDY